MHKKKLIQHQYQHLAGYQNGFPTTVEEIQNWLGLVLWMGLVQMPEVEMYWSNSTLFSTSFGKIISRNRFQLLASMIHYQNNETADKNNRFYKLGTLIDDVMINSNNCMIPSEIMCIDESVIPFTGRLLFKQYIKNKRHKYGIKLFKIGIPPNYTISIKVYSGKEATVDMKTSAEKGRKYAQAHSLKVRTMCLLCNRYVCQICFNDTHRSVLI